MKSSRASQTCFNSKSIALGLVPAWTVGTLWCASAALGQELVTDGGFEGADPSGGCWNDCNASCGFSIAPWTKLGGYYNTDLFANNADPLCQAHHPDSPLGGTYFMSLQGSVCCGCNNNGGISQLVATVAGYEYTFAADLFLDGLDSIDVSCAGASMQFNANNTPTMEWTRVTWTFIAGTAAPLELISSGATDAPEVCLSGDYAFIDNISLAFIPKEYVLDGGFEGALWNGACQNDCSETCGFTIAPWYKFGGWYGGYYEVDLIHNYPDGSCAGEWPFTDATYNPNGEAQFVSLQGSVCCGCNNNGGVGQSVDVVPGRRYVLSAELFLDDWDAIDVSCAGATTQFNANNTPTMQWVRVSWPFVASNPKAMHVSFMSVGTVATPHACASAAAADVDNVSLVEALPVSCAPDLDGDGVVGSADLAMQLGQWGECFDCSGDLSDDGVVDAEDLAQLLVAWGACQP